MLDLNVGWTWSLRRRSRSLYLCGSEDVLQDFSRYLTNARLPISLILEFFVHGPIAFRRDGDSKWYVIFDRAVPASITRRCVWRLLEVWPYVTYHTSAEVLRRAALPPASANASVIHKRTPGTYAIAILILEDTAYT